MFVVSRAQQQCSGINGTPRGHDNITGVNFLLALPFDSNRSDGAARDIGFESSYLGICQQRHVWMLERRLYAADLCVSLGIDQARKPVAGVAADTAGLMHVFFI